MSRIPCSTILVFVFLPVLAAQPWGPVRETDDAVPHRNAAEVAPGIRLANGSLCYAQTDLETKGRVLGLRLRRVWRGDMDFDGPLGRGWTCEYLQAAWRDETTTDILWHDAEGFLHTFVERDGGYRSPPGVYVRASWDAQTETVSLRRADGTTFDFNALGQLAVITDRHGNSVTLAYDGSNQLETVTDDRGYAWEFVWDDGRIVKLIDHVWETASRAAREIEYEYDAGNLVAVKLPETSRYNDADENRVTWAYSYEASNRLETVTAPNEAQVSGPACGKFMYDAAGRVISFRDGGGDFHQLRYTTNATGKPLVRHIDPLGARADYTLDAHGRMARLEQYTKFWAVDETEPIDHAYVVQAADKVRASDPNKYTTKYDFNRGHELTLVEHPAGNADQYSYPEPVRLARGRADDITGSVITLTGAEWTPGEFAGGYVRLGESLAEFAFYEVAGNTEDTLTVASVNVETQGWADNDRFVVFTENPDQLAAGNRLEHRRVSADVTQADIVESWTYEPYFQQVRSRTSARGHTTTWEFEFDATQDPEDGNVTAMVSPLTTILLPGGTTDSVVYETTYAWNQFGQLVETVDAAGATEVRYYYESGDEAGFLEEIVRAAGELDLTERFVYDKTGSQTGHFPPSAFEPGADAEEFKTTWRVNALGQRWQETGPIAAGDARVAVYRYFDASGNEVRTFRAYVTVDGDAPPPPTNGDDPNSFSKESVAMAATWVEVSREYDLAGRVTAETSDAIAGNPVETVTWANEYDPRGRLAARISPLLNRTGFEYDERGLLWRRVEGAGSAVEGAYEHDYSANGPLSATRTPLGHQTTRSFDGHGREVSVTDPEGHSIEYGLDAAGNRVSESCVDQSSAVLAQTLWYFDELERLNRQQRLALDAAGAPIGGGLHDLRLTLDARGNVAKRNDGPGRTWVLEYDAAGRLARQVDPVGNELELTLDAAGNVTLAEYHDWNEETETMENSQWQASYNRLGKPVQVHDRRWHPGFDTSVHFDWDGWQRMVVKTDAAGGSTVYSYDLLSRKTGEEENPDDELFSTPSQNTEWDRDSREDGFTVGGGLGQVEAQKTTYEHDARNRVVGITRPDETTVALAWDADSNLVGVTDEAGVETTCEYDGRGLMVSRTILGAAGGADEELFEYDGAGRVTETESRAEGEVLANTQFAWNTLHRVESRTLALGDLQGGLMGSWTTGAQFDERGNLAGEYFSDSTELTCGLDVLSRTVSVTDDSTETVLASFSWSGSDRVHACSYGNELTAGFTYEAGFAGPVARIEHARGGEVLWGVDRLHDLRGMPVRERRDHDGATGRAYWFDPSCRLTTAHVGADLAGPAFPAVPASFGMLTEYELDSQGSRTGEIDSDDGEATILETAYTVSADGMNRYAAAGGAAFAYDGTGRVTGDDASAVQYDWDFRGRVSAINVNAAGGVLMRGMRQDAMGLRVLEDEYEGGSMIRRAVLLHSPDGRPLEEIAFDAGGLETGRVQYAYGPLGIVAEKRDGDWLYRHCDQDGSLIGLTDEAGKRVMEYDYLPFGAPVKRGILLDVAPGEITECGDDALLSLSITTHICLSLGLTSGALTGHELAIAVPGAATNRHRTAAIVSNDSESITVDDPSGLIADAILNLGAGFVVYESRLSTTAPVVTYDSLDDSTEFLVMGAGFAEWLLGGWLALDVSRPAYLEIIEVDSGGDWLRVRGDATGMVGSGNYRALPPVGVNENGYTDAGSRYLYRGYRHDPAVRLSGWPNDDWANRRGTYTHEGRGYDPRTGRWMTPGQNWRNPYEYAPCGNLDDVTPPVGAPGLRGTWSPSPPCPAQSRVHWAHQYAWPTQPGWSG